VYDAVLWELAPDHLPDRQRVASLAKRLPVVSYSLANGRQVLALSRRLGFTAHLRAPLSPRDVSGQLARAKPVDLLEGVRAALVTLRPRLEGRAALADIVSAVGTTLEPRKIADALLDRVSGWFPSQHWAVITIHESGELATIVDRGVSALFEGELEPAVRWLIDRGEEFASANLAEERRIRTSRPVSALALPLTCRNRTIGIVLTAEPGASTGEIRWGPRLRAALRAILEPPAYALDHAIRYQRAQALSVTDDLTRLYNSRYLDQVLRRETKRASRNGRPLSLLFLDMDGFKSVNDRYGHLAGSRALVEAADVVRTSARETDICARFGGDEFAVVLPDTGGEGAYAVGERVRERLAAHLFLAQDGMTARLTASIGVATLPDVAASAEELLRAADKAMYRVKNGGKNGLHVAAEEDSSVSSEERS
jgi:diguanylate cyclase (GGDEF)-like protein